MTTLAALDRAGPEGREALGDVTDPLVAPVVRVPVRVGSAAVAARGMDASPLRSAAGRAISPPMTLAVVTGANRGIGLALTAALKARGAQVVAACRESSPALDALGVEVVPGVEVATDGGLEKLVAAVGARPVDLLINNAGVLIWGDQLGGLKVAGIRQQFEVNALAPLRITDALLDRLASGAKVALITSRMGSIDDNTSGGAYGYRMSKAALNMAGKSLAHDLRPRGVAVAILHPGMVKTEMIGGHGQVEPADAARDLLARIDECTLESSGGFWHANGQRLPW